MSTLEDKVRALVDTLPRCHDLNCAEIATLEGYDAASAPYLSCAAHASDGGIDGDEQPEELSYAKPLREVLLWITPCPTCVPADGVCSYFGPCADGKYHRPDCPTAVRAGSSR